jgi:hypothetical protein
MMGDGEDSECVCSIAHCRLHKSLQDTCSGYSST